MLSIQGDGDHDKTIHNVDSGRTSLVRVWRDPDVVAGRATPVAVDGVGDSGDASPEPAGEVLGDAGGEAVAPVYTPEPAAELPVREPGGLPSDTDACTRGPIESAICAAFGDAGPAAIRVAACESGTTAEGILDGTWAENGISYGVMQIWKGHVKRWPEMFDLNAAGIPNWADLGWNLSHAFELYVEQGWRPWSCRYAAW